MNDYDEQLCELASSGRCSAGYTTPSLPRAAGEPLWLMLRRAEDITDLRARQRLLDINPETKK